MSLIKTIFINVLVFCALMFLLMLAPPTLKVVMDAFRKPSSDMFAKTARMPAFEGYDWAQQSLWETYLVKLRYRDFVVQRGTDIAGEVVNVVDGVRRTVGTPVEGAGAPVWFFGGSTTWGYGVSDEFTYPSMFAQATGRHVTNYGEGAYTSRQSLAYLQGVYLLNPPGNRTVVFYDGVNDLMQGCNPTISSINQTAHEPRFRAATHYLEEPFTYRRLFRQLMDFIPVVERYLHLDEPEIFRFECAEDPERARRVARNLVTIWENAQRLVESNGDTFLAIYQPASFISTNTHPVLPDHPYNDELLHEYQAVHPLVLEELAKSDLPYIDLSHIYDDCQNCYYDHVHAGPFGHQRLVDALIDVVP